MRSMSGKEEASPSGVEVGKITMPKESLSGQLWEVLL